MQGNRASGQTPKDLAALAFLGLPVIRAVGDGHEIPFELLPGLEGGARNCFSVLLLPSMMHSDDDRLWRVQTEILEGKFY
jgi:hypothetical protein